MLAKALLFSSALTGIPPFYVVSVAASSLRVSLARFLLVGGSGRLLRFAAIVALPGGASRSTTHAAGAGWRRSSTGSAASATWIGRRSSTREFVDPLLPAALHDYWKSRYLTVEAAYSLSAVLQGERQLERALEVNDWLHERFPENPVGLYHRARILEESWAKARARQHASR